MFEDLELPIQERKQLKNIELEHNRKPQGYRRKGVSARLSLQRSAVERVRRLQIAQRSSVLNGNAASDADLGVAAKVAPESPRGTEAIPPLRSPFWERDLRFRRRSPKLRRESNAVVICIMDTSGSMDVAKKYLARSFFFCSTASSRRNIPAPRWCLSLTTPRPGKPPKRSSFEKVNQAEPLSLQATTRLSR